MQIGPRTDEMENHCQHFWYRKINGKKYWFLHVKQSILKHPWYSVNREEMDGSVTLVRCSCGRSDCPFPT